MLRLFLGATFVYAGIQKFTDPSYLATGVPGSIGVQLHEFALGSPISPLLLWAARFPLLTGIAVGVGELLIGLGTLAGIAVRWCAVGGLLLNVSLWLSATWHVYPYFLGSDSIYALAWIVLLIGLFETHSGQHAG